MFAHTSPLILWRGAITRAKARRRKRQHTPSGQSQTDSETGNTSPIPLEELSLHEPIDEELYVQSTIFQSNSWPGRNESITRRNQFLSRCRTKRSIVMRNTTGTADSHRSSLRVSDDSRGNERSTGDRASPDPSALRNKDSDVVDTPIASGGGASTSDDVESREVLVIEKEGKAQTRFVRVSSVF